MPYPLYLKDPTGDKPTAIRMRVYIKGRPHHYATGESIYPDAWDFENQICKTGKRYPLAGNTNIRLGRVLNGAEIIQSRFNTDAITPSWQQFKDALDKHLERSVAKPSEFWQYVDDFIARAKASRKAGDRLIVNYNQTHRVLKEFEKGRAGLNFDLFDQVWYDRFVVHCRKKYKDNTTGKHIKTLKTWLNAATLDGVNTNLQFKRYVKLTERTDEIYLTVAEIQKMIDLDLSGTEAIIRDIFVFACFTGLRYVDYMQVKRNAISGNNLYLHQSKTGDPVIIPLRPECIAVLARYGGELPRVPENQTMNRELKGLAKKAGVEEWKAEKVKTHTARRSFATNLYLAGFPANDIMKITGHKTEKSFLLYIRIASIDTALRLRKFWNMDL